MHFKKLAILRSLKKKFALDLAMMGANDMEDDELLNVLLTYELDREVCSAVEEVLGIPETDKVFMTSISFRVFGRIIGYITNEIYRQYGKKEAMFCLNILAKTINKELTQEISHDNSTQTH